VDWAAKPVINRQTDSSDYKMSLPGRIAAVLTLALIVGCSAPPKDYPRTVTTAHREYLETNIGRFFEKEAARFPDRSGFAIVRYGRPAFTARVTMTELAEKSIDMQYYVWQPDITGRIFAERLLRAADRGVRVRILVDDIGLSGRDQNIAALDAHPKIEIRVFNPFASRNARFFDFISDFDRVNHRMHNKIMVTDNAFAIVGGRNIGDHYFGVNAESNFRDLDVAAAGPLVRDVSNLFDHFWNGDWAVPISALMDKPSNMEDLKRVSEKTREHIEKHKYPYPLDQDVADFETALRSIRDNLIWAPGNLVWDDPAAIEHGIKEGSIARSIRKKLDMVQHEVLIETAYFVVVDRGVETVKQLRDSGVRIRVLTNSLASNDVLAAHGGYAKRRTKLVENGLELFEIRPDAVSVKKRLFSAKSRASLHTKVMVFDKKSALIGSVNMDQRSAAINTESFVYVESPELAAQVAAYMEKGVRPENSYKVVLDDDGDLVWITEVDGAEVRYRTDPESTFWQRLVSNFIGLLPVEHQL